MMPQDGTETREDVMRTSNLHTLLCERTAAEYRLRWEKKHSKPPIGSMILTFVLGGLLYGFGMVDAAWIFLLLTALQGAWAVWSVMTRVMTKAGEAQEEILRGHFPAECAPHVMMRLRWWNHLIVPQQWARHSRIHERRRQLEAKLTGLHQRMNALQEESEATEAKKRELSEDEVLSLASRINNLAERLKYDARIAAIQDELPRLTEEWRLYAALYHKISQVTDMLERIEKLGVVATGKAPADLTEMAERACRTLEERRRLVLTVDNIDPDEFLELVKV